MILFFILAAVLFLSVLSSLAKGILSNFDERIGASILGDDEFEYADPLFEHKYAVHINAADLHRCDTPDSTDEPPSYISERFDLLHIVRVNLNNDQRGDMQEARQQQVEDEPISSLEIIRTNNW